MSFELATVMKRFPLSAMVRPTGGGQISLQLPRTGFLANLILNITGTVSGSLSNPNALGMASILNRIRLTAQGGVDLFNVSGPGYFYLLRDMLDIGYVGNLPSASPYAAVTATTFDLSMIIPLRLNDRDHAGLIPLQNEATLLTLTLDWLADASVATGATVVGTCVPSIELFTVPVEKADWPKLDLVHVIQEDQQVIAGAGDVTYDVPRGDVLIRLIHGAGFAQSPADSWSRSVLRVNESDVLEDYTPGELNLYFYKNHKAARTLGVIPFDRISSSGFGNYGLIRDAIDTRRLSSLKTVTTVTGALTFYSIRETLVKIA